MELDDFINPIKLFNQWFSEAEKKEVRDPNAMQLATVSKSGMPSVRTVLLKEIIDGNFIFYTNYESRKANEILETKKAWANFVISYSSSEPDVNNAKFYLEVINEAQNIHNNFSLKETAIAKTEELKNTFYLLDHDSVQSGFGLDSLWSIILKHKDIAVIDYIPVIHKRPVGHFNKKKTTDNQYLGVKNLLNYLIKKQIKSFIQIGSSAEYGITKSPQREKSKCKPKLIYGKAKFQATKYVQKISRKKLVTGIILRLYQVYGPMQPNNRFLPTVINKCLNNKNYFKFVHLSNYIDFR